MKLDVSRFSTCCTSLAIFALRPCLGWTEKRVTMSQGNNNNSKYWNREESTDKGKYLQLLKTSPKSGNNEARVLSLSKLDDDANKKLHDGELPIGSKLLGIGQTLEDFNKYQDDKPNVLVASPSCPNAKIQLPLILKAFPSIEWVHCRSAGIDFVFSDELSTFHDKVIFTNAKGHFSSTLAEYTMMAISYFAKDLPRLLKNKNISNWEKYSVEEIRGKTLGIIGYGDIGRACAKLANVYGMKIIALRRNPNLSSNDPYCDVVYGSDKASLNKLMSESNYILCAAPLTPDTRGYIDANAFNNAKANSVFINVGRGAIVDEQAMITALKTNQLKGAALDVFTIEPLPKDNELWNLENVLISPHNMDQTATFMHEATEFFLTENLPRFICGENVLNPVDVKSGY